jgi:hypothetical protein
MISLRDLFYKNCVSLLRILPLAQIPPWGGGGVQP